MPIQDWTQIKRVFSAALAVPLEERNEYLESACKDRTDVKLAVEELLRAHYDASQTFLEPTSIVLASSWIFREGEHVAERFKVVKRIARGAMGEVYHVYDERLRLNVALKAIRPELLHDPDTVERFRREVLVTRTISHENLCRVFDLVEHASGPLNGLPDNTIIPCLTMELLQGESLDEWLAHSRPMSAAAALPLVRQMADALQQLHDASVVHRDLKPSNVMLVPTPAGTRAVLTDFGLAKPLDASVFETQTGLPGGAPFFMAPELFRRERPSKHSDIYAFGLLIDEMVTSTRAFSADSLHALLLQKLGDGPTPPAARAAGLPSAWACTILRCLASNPDDRFENVRDVMDGLVLGRPLERPRSRDARLALVPIRPTRLARRRVTYAAAAVLVVTGMATVGNPMQLSQPSSVMIHPFENLTQKADLAYLATGTTGELGRRLSRVPGLRVYSAIDSAAVQQTRPVTYSVRGHIQEVKGQLRITVELNDGAVGRLLWSERVEGGLNQSLQIEDQLAAETVGAMRRVPAPDNAGLLSRAIGTLTRWIPYQPHVPSSGTTSNAAFDHYLRGRTLFEERTIPSALQAIEYLQKALKEDPNYAAAYATLADVQGVLMDLNYASHATLLAEAERYINQAMVLGPDLPDVQLTLGLVRQMQWRWEEAEQAYKRAIELHPTLARAHRWYGGLQLQFGLFEESLEKHRYALELDPYDFPSQSALGHALFHAGHAKEAAAALEALLARKDLLYGHAMLGQVYAYLAGAEADPGRRTDYLKKALTQSDIVRRLDGRARIDAAGTIHSDYADLIAVLAWGYQGNAKAARPFMERLLADHADGHIAAGLIARAYAGLKDNGHAMEALLEAEIGHERELYYINVSPLYAGLRQDPQFRALVTRIGLSR